MPTSLAQGDTCMKDLKWAMQMLGFVSWAMYGDRWGLGDLKRILKG